jgi:hypothetical protein
MDTIQLTPAALALVPIVAAILQVLKRIEVIAKLSQWLPFVSMGIALGLGYLTNIPDPIVPSILIGLLASGSYDAVKSISK